MGVLIDKGDNSCKPGGVLDPLYVFNYLNKM